MSVKSRVYLQYSLYWEIVHIIFHTSTSTSQVTDSGTSCLAGIRARSLAAGVILQLLKRNGWSESSETTPYLYLIKYQTLCHEGKF